MARKRQPKYRILAYDGYWKARDLVASASGGHRIQEGYDKKDEVLKRAQEWMAAHPPQAISGGYEDKAHVEISERGDRVALWKAKDGKWVEVINHLRRQRNTSALKARLIAMPRGARRPNKRWEMST